ncbi:glutathionylspermidine synthase family protein [Parvularcula dongshanensis]|uniref:Glutathionylspermidine synthase n=1 Tax=Parvularcula dongshanensis TaxID=1173995 RepID=A0A840I2T6_9PROT|nr:glutathionylspermidine synthase family protein [Parvularcula dongshanensis]MBB4658645.1 glutathionylspermidine synthase [Parvularcula dongshanensis]
MRRFTLPPRTDWRSKAEAVGFIHHTVSGAPYWQDGAAYAFTLAEIEEGLEEPCRRLHAMCLEVVDHAASHRPTLRRLAIPDRYHDWIEGSWAAKQPSLYGRFDLRFDGEGPAKLYEYNADTPTSVFEAAAFQWLWLEDRLESGELPPGTDQFTSLHEALVARWRDVADPSRLLHFLSVDDGFEDRATTLYLEDTARQAGFETRYTAMDEIGVDLAGRYADDGALVIEQAFKLYPWEFMHREPFGPDLVRSATRWIEPPWKAILSNKALLALLWEGWPDHDNLLPAVLEGEGGLAEPYVRKPIYGREGADIELVGGGMSAPSQGYGAEGYVHQAYAPLPDFGGHRPVLGVWIVGDEACGLGIREGGMITDDEAMFLPHVIDPPGTSSV